MAFSSKRPEKELVWLWLTRDAKLSKGANRSLDLSCGRMRHRSCLETPNYIGVGLDEQRLELGARDHPDAVAIVSAIEHLPVDVTGDFVICMETIGINTRFQSQNTIIAIQKVIAAVEISGTLIFNIGGEPLSKYEHEIDGLLSSTFEFVDKREYGAFHERTSRLRSHVLARLMLWFPALRHGSSRRAYYLCTGRSGEPD